MSIKTFVVEHQGDLLRVIETSSDRYEVEFPEKPARLLRNYKDQGEEIEGWSFRKYIEDEEDDTVAQEIGALIEEWESANKF